MPAWLFQDCIFKIANPEPLCDGKGKPLCILLSFDYSKNILGISKVPAVNRQRVSLDESAGLKSGKSLVPDVSFSKVVVAYVLLSFAYSENILGVCKVPAVNPQPGKLWWGCRSAERKVACVRRTFLKVPKAFRTRKAVSGLLCLYSTSRFQ